MQFFKDNKTTIGAVIIVGLLVYVYFTYFRGDSSGPLLTTTTETTTVSSELLVTLSKLHVIELNNAIFSDPVFTSLTDFGVQIDPQNIGRRNPFAPIGGN